MKENQLIEAAKQAREKAYVPYSKFPVGAAVLTNDEQIITGCNIENASYGLTNCAERTAIFKMVAEGRSGIQAIAVVADTPQPVSPCGACRQVMAEFCKPDTKVILGNLKGDRMKTTVSELLPFSFSKEDMHDDSKV